MSGGAYYNEIDPAAAAVLRHLVAVGVIAPGEVDTRSIKEVQADDLRGFTQCHFFAGGGLWSVAARMAGWPDTRPLWTGSCPCQPFSAAGKGAGTDDPRHLWPDFHRLISAARPAVVMGEQVAGAPGYGWFDGVRADLAGEDYASRCVDIPASAVDAPHQRNRLYWIAVAEPDRWRHEGRSLRGPGESSRSYGERSHDQSGGPDGRELADAIGSERDGRTIEPQRGSQGRDASVGADARSGRSHLVNATSIGRGEGRPEHEIRGRWPAASGADASGDMGNAILSGLERHAGNGDHQGQPEPDRSDSTADGARAASELAHSDLAQLQGQPSARQRALDEPHARSGGRNGSAWADAEWITCHDGKARRTKPGLRLLVDGLPGRVDLWRVGGNAIVPIEAAEVIGAYLDTEREAA